MPRPSNPTASWSSPAPIPRSAAWAICAGGIGVALDDAIDFLHWDRVATILLAILVVVIAEIAVTRIRERLI